MPAGMYPPTFPRRSMTMADAAFESLFVAAISRMLPAISAAVFWVKDDTRMSPKF